MFLCQDCLVRGPLAHACGPLLSPAVVPLFLVASFAPSLLPVLSLACIFAASFLLLTDAALPRLSPPPRPVPSGLSASSPAFASLRGPGFPAWRALAAPLSGSLLSGAPCNSVFISQVVSPFSSVSSLSSVNCCYF